MARILNTNHKSKRGDNVVVKTAAISDAEKMRSLAMTVFQSSDYLIATPEEFSAITTDQQIARIKKFEDHADDIWLLAESNGEIVGMIDFLSGKSKKVKHKGSFGMCVHPAWQSQGIGKILLSALIEWVKAHPHIEVMNLTVSEENKPAVALYKKLGFQITGREPYGLKNSKGEFLVDLTMTLKA